MNHHSVRIIIYLSNEISFDTISRFCTESPIVQEYYRSQYKKGHMNRFPCVALNRFGWHIFARLFISGLK
jgi:hypothetical protein